MLVAMSQYGKQGWIQDPVGLTTTQPKKATTQPKKSVNLADHEFS
jgi:hypothetical protein